MSFLGFLSPAPEKKPQKKTILIGVATKPRPPYAALNFLKEEKAKLSVFSSRFLLAITRVLTPLFRCFLCEEEGFGFCVGEKRFSRAFNFFLSQGSHSCLVWLTPPPGSFSILKFAFFFFFFFFFCLNQDHLKAYPVWEIGLRFVGLVVIVGLAI